jgi:hypothetical protein
MDMQSLYDFYRHYGTIESKEDFEFKEEEIFITMVAIKYENARMLFIIRNGEAVYTEGLKGN